MTLMMLCQQNTKWSTMISLKFPQNSVHHNEILLIFIVGNQMGAVGSAVPSKEEIKMVKSKSGTQVKKNV